MLFKITATEDPFDLNPELKSIPEFAALPAKKFKYVAFLVDYKSPFRQHTNLTEKKRLCLLQAGYVVQGTHQKTLEPRAREIMNGEVPEVEAAILKYKEIQYDDDREDIELYNTQIANIRAAVRNKPDDPAELEKVNKLLLSLPSLRAAKRQIAESVGIEIPAEESSSEVSKPMSTLDEMMNEQIKIKDI